MLPTFVIVCVLNGSHSDWSEVKSPDKGLVTRIYKELNTLNSQRIDDPMKIWTNENSDFNDNIHIYIYIYIYICLVF
jgi:hypothetical protein